MSFIQNLQRRASFQTRKGRCSTLNCCIISSLNRFRFRELCRDQHKSGRMSHDQATQDRPLPFARPTLILFHPDFNRRLRNRTGSADPSPAWTRGKALAGSSRNSYRRWGVSPRPENRNVVDQSPRGGKSAPKAKGVRQSRTPLKSWTTGLVSG